MQEANFLDIFSGSLGLIKPWSNVSAIIFEAKETLFLEILTIEMIECDTDSDTDTDEMIEDGNVPMAVKPVAVFIEAVQYFPSLIE